jgi:hypothetical protein
MRSWVRALAHVELRVSDAEGVDHGHRHRSRAPTPAGTLPPRVTLPATRAEIFFRDVVLAC